MHSCTSDSNMQLTVYGQTAYAQVFVTAEYCRVVERAS